MYTYAMLGCFSERACCIITCNLSTHMCKFLHACVASYTRIHGCKLSMHVLCLPCAYISQVYPMCVDFMLHTWDMHGPFKL